MTFQALEILNNIILKKLIKVLFSILKNPNSPSIDDRRGHVEENPKFLDEEKVKEKVEREKDEDL